MTDKEKAIVMAHTGICMLTGDKFQIFHKYVEDIMGRPIMTHEIGRLEDTIKEKTKADFIALCADEKNEQIPDTRDIRVTAEEAAEAIQNLTKAGISQEDIESSDFKMTECDRCQHFEMCSWRESLEERGCDFFDDGNKWVPVSERLPKESGYYLTTTMYHEVYCDYWEEDCFNRTEAVIAWMPLPDKYNPQESEERNMNDKNQVKLLQDAIEAYENGEILEAKDKATEFINNITDFEAESEE